mmetsp:Transcript_13855/g.47910  ORF Transcript_13855/g.47910 Transcript_13855/m.47910 type:complete len:418 (-) Transcript_13855:49-1302(-)
MRTSWLKEANALDAVEAEAFSDISREQCSSHANSEESVSNHPLVLVPGFLAPSSPSEGGWENIDGAGAGAGAGAWYKYWGRVAELNSCFNPVLCVWPCGFASLHDRACEVFYQIKGGKVDYGEEHSQRFGHARYGRLYPGLFSEWSSERPIHMLGHSLGGATARYLQHLLEARAFPGHATDASWILSLSSLSAPLNGTLTTYALGEEEDAPPRVRRLSPGSILGSLVHVLAMCGGRMLGYELGLEQWKLSMKDVGAGAAIKKLVRCLLVHSDLVEEEDNAAYDTTIHAMKKHNESMGGGHGCCYYFSFVGTSEQANQVPRMEGSLSVMNMLTWILTLMLFVFRRSFLLLLSWRTRWRKYEGLRGLEGVDVEEWKRGGDGLCPVYSQRFPVVGISGHVPSCKLNREDLRSVKPGERSS